MKTVVYLLRKPVDLINPAVFHPSDSRGDVVLVEGNAGGMSDYRGGDVFSVTGHEGHRHMTFDDLVKKIFECDHAVVI